MAKKVGKLARRYARALLAAVKQELGDQGSPTPGQVVAGELENLAAVWRDDPQLSIFVVSPMFNAAERLGAITKVAQAVGASQLVERFVRVLFERDRIAALPEIAQSFAELADETAGVVKVQIATAREVSEGEAREIEGMIASAIKGRPVFAWSVKSELLGGIVVNYSGRVIDGSVTSQLERMERWLVG